MNDLSDQSMTAGHDVSTQEYRLDQLYLHSLNTRTEPPSLEIEELAGSIRSCGLVQNLCGYVDSDLDGIGIVAGGRRLRALQLLAERGEWAGMVPVKVTDDRLIAEVWANVENTARANLHPADEIRAYGRMADSGADTTTIARAFAVTEAHVKRRLKLAHLPASALDALKANHLSLGQAAALTVSDDPARIAEVLADILAGSFANPENIQRKLIGDDIRNTDRRARFVGLDLYEASGGRVTRDLFSDYCWLHDADLLDGLFARRLEEEAAKVEGDGWGFVWMTPDASAHDDKRMQGITTIDPPELDLPEGDEAELEELEETPYWQLTDEQKQRIGELAARTIGEFDDEVKATLGAMVLVNYAGALKVIGGLQKRDKTQHEGDGEATGSTTAPAPDATPAISDALRQDFLIIARAALQTALAAKPDMVLDLLAFQFHWAEAGHARDTLFRVSADKQPVTPSDADMFSLTKALQEPDTRTCDWKSPTPADLAAFRAQDGFKKARNEILTRAFTRALMALPGDLTTAIATQAGMDIRAIWCPTTKNCFGRMKSAMLVAIYADLLQPEDGDERFAAFQAMKAKDQARELGDLFSNMATREAYGLDRDTGQRIDAWVPAEMRG